jgi:hypothetical protein
MRSIDQVIDDLKAIVQDCIQQKDALGIFAAVYLRTTVAVREAIRQGRFEDNPRMERLDVIFADRYIDALKAYRAGLPCTQSWKQAFDASRNNRLIGMQHLMLGMNAHILLDLGIAAAQVCPGAQIKQIENDFNKINEVLMELLDVMQDAMAQMSFVYKLLDKFGMNLDEKIASGGIKLARVRAWQVAQNCAAATDPAALQKVIAETDTVTQGLSKGIIHTPGFLNFLLGLIKMTETGDVEMMHKLS